MNLSSYIVFHVGGRGKIGRPARVFKSNCLTEKKLYIFEADLNDAADEAHNAAFSKNMKKRHWG